MKCWNCGKENTEDDVFCIYCGSKLKKDPVITDSVSEKRSVQSILEEYLPQLSKSADNGGGFAAAPGIIHDIVDVDLIDADDAVTQLIHVKFASVVVK